MNIDYNRIPALKAAARRERAREVHRLLIAPLLALFRARPLRRSRMIHRRAYC
jgi:hypothetical protein